MRSIMRGALLTCLVTSLISLAACETPFANKAGSAPTGIHVTRCDGSTVERATTTEPQAPAPAFIYAGADVGDHIGSGKQGLVALSAADGAQSWCVRFALTRTYACPPSAHCPPPPFAMVGMPLVVGAVVYVCVSGGGPGVTYAFDATNGALRWSRDTGCRIVSIPFGDNALPILADGVLYSGSVGLATADGAVRWRLPPSVAQDTIGAVSNGVAYVYGEETVSAVRLADGVVTWTYTLDAPIGNRPAPLGSHVYVGDIAGDSPPAVVRGLRDTYALDIRTGAVVWRAPTGIVAGSTAVEANGLVYIGAENALNALDAVSGAFRWRMTLPHDGYVASTPVVANGLVYFVADGAYAVDALTGAVRWHNALGWDQAIAFAGPTLGGSALYLTSFSGDLRSVFYALDPASGAIQWQRSDVNALTSPAV